MEIDNVSEALQSTPHDPISAVQDSEWNGRDIQTIPQTRGWIVLRIPTQTLYPVHSLAYRVTSVNSGGFPTVEEVLQQHGLTFGNRFYDREFEQLTTSEYTWVVIPLNSDYEYPPLLNRAIDTNDYDNIDRVLERQGIFRRDETVLV